MQYAPFLFLMFILIFVQLYESRNGRWSHHDSVLIDGDASSVINEVKTLVLENAYRNLHDFQAHLDNITLDWTIGGWEGGTTKQIGRGEKKGNVLTQRTVIAESESTGDVD